MSIVADEHAGAGSPCPASVPDHRILLGASSAPFALGSPPIRPSPAQLQHGPRATFLYFVRDTVRRPTLEQLVAAEPKCLRGGAPDYEVEVPAATAGLPAEALAQSVPDSGRQPLDIFGSELYMDPAVPGRHATGRVATADTSAAAGGAAASPSEVPPSQGFVYEGTASQRGGFLVHAESSAAHDGPDRAGGGGGGGGSAGAGSSFGHEGKMDGGGDGERPPPSPATDTSLSQPREHPAPPEPLQWTHIARAGSGDFRVQHAEVQLDSSQRAPPPLSASAGAPRLSEHEAWSLAASRHRVGSNVSDAAATDWELLRQHTRKWARSKTSASHSATTRPGGIFTAPGIPSAATISATLAVGGTGRPPSVHSGAAAGPDRPIWMPGLRGVDDEAPLHRAAHAANMHMWSRGGPGGVLRGAPVAEHVGELTKRGAIFKTWRRRRFDLRDGLLRYYRPKVGPWEGYPHPPTAPPSFAHTHTHTPHRPTPGRTQDEANPRGTIPMACVTAIEMLEPRNAFGRSNVLAIDVERPQAQGMSHRRYYLQADTPQEQRVWMDVLSQAAEAVEVGSGR